MFNVAGQLIESLRLFIVVTVSNVGKLHSYTNTNVVFQYIPINAELPKSQYLFTYFQESIPLRGNLRNQQTTSVVKKGSEVDVYVDCLGMRICHEQ